MKLFQKPELAIISINALIFLSCNILTSIGLPSITKHLALSFSFNVLLHHPWTLLSFMFTHVSVGHVFWNMILFYMNLRFFYTFFKPTDIWKIYIYSGLAGACTVLALGFFTSGYVIGASASVLGMMAMITVFSPDYPVHLWGLIELRYKYFFGLVFVLSTLIDLNQNAAGKLTHVGGAAFGFIYAYYLKKGFPKLFKPKTVFRVIHNTGEDRMNSLLDKISKNGYASLSKRERDELQQLSKK